MTIPVFFTPDQIHVPLSYSKSPLKPKLLAEYIRDDPAFSFIGADIIGPVAADRLELIHDKDFVTAIFAGKRFNGFGDNKLENLKAIRNTVGNFLVAAEWAVGVTNPGVVWSLTSGFHHARYSSCGGFCTFDALSLAAFELQKFRGLRTLLIDEDNHYGDGCVDNRAKNKMQGYYSYMQSRHTHGHNTNLVAYREEIEHRIADFKPDVIFYQAGADNWHLDPLCFGGLTMSQLYQRDIITFHVAKTHGIPVVVNLAGGYAKDYEDTLRIHRNTGEAMKEVYLGRGCATIPSHDITEEVQ